MTSQPFPLEKRKESGKQRRIEKVGDLQGLEEEVKRSSSTTSRITTTSGPDEKTSKSRFGLSKKNAETEQKPPSRALTARR